jgi:hypothetical protein
MALLAAFLSLFALNASAVEPKTYDGIPYVSGGIGEGEREAMRPMSADYNLWLWFATKDTGANLADVQVTVQDKNQTPVLDVVSDGPWLMARLPAGTYKVKATSDGATQVKTVTVGAAARSPLILRFVN